MSNAFTPAAFIVRLPERASVVPPAECACCGALSVSNVLVEPRSHRGVLAGYCQECAEHVARWGTRRLAALLAAFLIALPLAAGLPIVAPFWSLGACIAVTWIAGLVPLLVLLRWRRPPRPHLARGPAVFFRAPSELVCYRQSWAEKVSRSSGATVLPVARARRFVWVPFAPASLVAGVVAPLSYTYQHPPLRVLNLGEVPIEMRVDARSFGQVEPSSTESPLAGLATRIPAGKRELSVSTSSGELLARVRVDVLPGRDHLYAPVAPGICFWLERSAYGRAEAAPQFIPLVGDSAFWPVPEEVQGWFVPGPPPGTGARTTGGSATVLRQGVCEEMPANP